MKRRPLLALAAAAVPFGASTLARSQPAPLKIGVLTDLSSVASDNTGRGSVVAAQMAIAEAGGSVAGRPITLLSADHQNKVDVGATIARQWVDEGVHAIVDVPNSAVALAVQDITRQAGRMLLMSAAGSSELTGRQCSPTGVQWTYDTYALGHATGRAVVEQGGDTWFFLAADYAFGQALQSDASDAVAQAGGKVLGGVKSPLGTTDYSSFLLQAQSSGAKIIGLATAGSDTVAALKQFGEFGLRERGQSLAGLLVGLAEVKSVGLEATQGLLLTEAFYWDLNDATRAFGKSFFAQLKRMPTHYHAGVNSVVSHYLKAVQATGGPDDALAVAAAMRHLPINDFFARDGVLREDGRMVHDMYLFRVKRPDQSRGEWDLSDLVATVPGQQAFRPMAAGGCPHARL